MSDLYVGPLETLLQDPTVNEIQVQPETILCRRGAETFSSDLRFADAAERWRVIRGIVQAGGQTLSTENPVVACVLADGTQVHAVLDPLSLTLRKANQPVAWRE